MSEVAGERRTGMRHRITIIDEQDTLPINMQIRNLIRKAIRLVLKDAAIINSVELTVLFVNTAEMRRFCLTYTGQDKVTDVLSFPVEDASAQLILPQNLVFRPLGDIVISPEVAAINATEQEHTIIREVVWLAVHGLLHLLGYNHGDNENDEALAEMICIQDTVVQRTLKDVK